MAQSASERQAVKRVTKGKAAPAGGARRIDFNVILRTIEGFLYPSLQGVPLRLGKVCVDALMHGGRQAQNENLAQTNKLGQLADLINKTDFAAEAVEAVPYAVLALSDSWCKTLDEEVAGAGFLRGVRLATHRMLFPDEQLPALDGVEVLEDPDIVEQAELAPIDSVPDAEDGKDEPADAEGGS